MPNWCHNTLTVEGNPEQLTEFKSKSFVKAKHSSPEEFDFTFEGLFPTPPELLEETAPTQYRGEDNDTEAIKTFHAKMKDLEYKYDYTNWYDWRVNYWGCKWDASESYISSEDEAHISVEFDTAWSPPEMWVRYVSTLFPDLKFKLSYMEPGVGFAGVFYKSSDMDEVIDGDIAFEDENGNEVKWDADIERYRINSTNEVIDDQDFYPIEVNPYI